MTWIIPTKTNGQRTSTGARARPSLGRKMPRQKPGLSEQKVGTPWEFIDAVEERFGSLTLDLASTPELAKAEHFITPEEDTFRVPWVKRMRKLAPVVAGRHRGVAGGVGYLNPEFGNIRPYAAKMDAQAQKLRMGYGERLLLLVPASVGAHWFEDHVWNKALVLFLRPRLKFIGHTTHFPKDLMLCVYGEEPGIDLWQWADVRGRKRT